MPLQTVRQRRLPAAARLTDPEFAKTNITITAARDEVNGGNNSVNVGFLNAEENPLGAVKISGGMGRINAGLEVLM